MYIVNLINDLQEFTIHGEREKLNSGSIVKGINAIDSFSFSILPSNIGFNQIFDMKTLVTVYNTNRSRYEFFGRALYSSSSMDASGLIVKDVLCESYFGFLCDSQQGYVEETNWTVSGLLECLINEHNSQVEDYKQFVVGEITVEDPNDNLYVGIQRENTWQAINDKLISKLGGEIRFRVVDDLIYIDYLKEIGETRNTAIELSKNMKSITREDDPTAYISRLIPLGCKLKDDEGNETEERLDITSVNDGLNYIESPEALAVYGVKYGYVTYDDVTEASNLLSKGRAYLEENNKVKIKYSITALDLSLLGLDIDDFDICNYYPIKNPLLGIDDVARIVKKTVDVCEEVKSSFEIGDNFKTLSELQKEQANEMKNYYQRIEWAKNELKDYVNKTVSDSESNLQQIIIENNTTMTNDFEQILFSALESYTLTGDFETFKQTVESELSVIADEIRMNFTTTTEQITDIDGDLQSKFEEVYKYISFSDSGIQIGSNDSAITLQVDNEAGIVFSKNGVVFGWWDGENFYTGNIVVEVNKRAQFGNFAFVPRSDGSLSFLKVDNEILVDKLIKIGVDYDGGDVLVGTDVNDLTGITVYAYYSGSTVEVTDYTLTGKIVEGTNVITVTYEGKKATFEVVGYIGVTLSGISVVYTGGDVPAGTSVNALTGITVTAEYSDGSTETVTDYTLSGTIAEGDNTIYAWYGDFFASFHVVGVATGNGYVLGTAGEYAVALFMLSNSGATVQYADEIEVVDGALSLVSPKSTTFYTTTSSSGANNNYNALLGKFVKHSSTDTYYYIDPSSSYRQGKPTSGYVNEYLWYTSAYPVSVAG